MKLEVLFFATIKLRTGVNRAVVELKNETATVNELLTEVEALYPKVSSSMPSLLVAVNKEFASREQVLKPGDEVAIFPPVSGG